MLNDKLRELVKEDGLDAVLSVLETITRDELGLPMVADCLETTRQQLDYDRE